MLSLVDGAMSLVLETLVPEYYSRDGQVLEVKRFIQPDEYSCAVQSCRSLLNFYGIMNNERVLRKELKTDEEEGTNERQIIRTLRKYGLKTEVMEWASMERLRDAIDEGIPVVVSLDFDEHWGLVYGYSPNYIYLMDPYPGNAQKLNRWDFRWRWGGWGIVAY